MFISSAPAAGRLHHLFQAFTGAASPAEATRSSTRGQPDSALHRPGDDGSSCRLLLAACYVEDLFGSASMTCGRANAPAAVGPCRDATFRAAHALDEVALAQVLANSRGPPLDPTCDGVPSLHRHGRALTSASD